VALLAGCKKEKGEIPTAALPVNVVTAIEREVTPWSEFTGRTEAVDYVEIRPRVSGYVTEIKFKDGSLVKKGDPLFVIDPRPYQAELDRATANAEQAEAQQKLAQLDFDRVENLRQKQVVAAEEYDRKAAALLQAQASLHAAQAVRQTAALNVGFTSVESPIDGKVSAARVTVGNLVQAGGGAENVLTTVVSTDPFYVYADADENTVLQFMQQRDQARRANGEQQTPAFLQLANEKGFPHQGYIDFVDNRLDPGTGTLRLRGVFKSWDPLLAPGFFVRMRVPRGPKYRAVLIPEEVVSSQQNVKFVYVVKPDKTIERRNIEIGEEEEGLRIVRSGLKGGEQVVSTRLQILRPGMAVQVAAQ
jgi:RND family efflux transporter MFP subunit